MYAHALCVCVCLFFTWDSASNIFVPDYVVYSEIHSARAGTYKMEKKLSCQR